MPKTRVFGVFHFLQGCSLQEKAVTGQQFTSRDFKWPKVTRKYVILPEVPGSGCRRPKTRVLCGLTAYKVYLGGGSIVRVFGLLQPLTGDFRPNDVTSASLPVVGGHMTSFPLTWLLIPGSDAEVTSFGRKSPGSGCRRPKTLVLCVFHFLQGCSLQEEAVTWQEMMSHHLWWPGSDVIWPKSPGSGCRMPKISILCAFNFLQGCSLQDEMVTWMEMTSRDFRWPEVTRNWHLTGTHLEVAVEGQKLAYYGRFNSYKVVF